ncbi:MAG: exosortase-associated EpsI family protein [Pirellulaceae bacterium]
MRLILFTIAAVLLPLGTLGSGWLHGEMTDRSKDAATLRSAAKNLQGALPSQLGPWRLAKTQEIDEAVAKILQCAASHHAVYTNDQTGNSVQVALVAGPSGPISVHTPEICYSSQDYEMAAQRQEMTIKDRNGTSHTFWNLRANSRHETKPSIRAIYGWSDGRAWRAVGSPRFAFAGLPVLYKLEISGPPLADASQPETDPCHDFLTRFLADLSPRLVRSSRISFLAN